MGPQGLQLLPRARPARGAVLRLSSQRFVSDLRVFSVDADAGITPRGAISLADVYQTYQYQDWTWSWSPWIRRSVMADDFVYAISDSGVRVANASSLARPIATATFDRALYR
jgi:hypothetical protein